MNSGVVLSESVRAGTLHYSVVVPVPGFIFSDVTQSVAAVSETSPTTTMFSETLSRLSQL